MAFDVLQFLKDSFDYWQNVILASGVFVAIFVAAWTVKHDKKNLKLNALNLVFQKLNDPNERESRRKILSAYYDYLTEHEFPTEFTYKDFLEKHRPIDLIEIYPDLREDVEKIKANFDEIGAMEKNGLLSRNVFFDAYYGSLLRCYGALHGNIVASRVRTGSEEYTSFFERLAKKAIEFWGENHKNSPIKYHGIERTDFTVKRFQESGTWRIRINGLQTKIQNCTVYCNKDPAKSMNHNDTYPHTIEAGSGGNFEIVDWSENPLIKIKSLGHTIKTIRFFELEVDN